MARYLVEADDHFIIKGNQTGLLEDLMLYFQKRQEPERVTVDLRACDGEGLADMREVE